MTNLLRLGWENLVSKIWEEFKNETLLLGTYMDHGISAPFSPK